jgi:HAD superfamily hydrolase (TIGR01509 family)
VCNTAITPTVPPIPPRHSKSLGLNVFFPAWVWAQNPDPDGQHPERSIRPDCWMGSGVRFAHLSYDAEFSRFLGEANIERCITKFNAILSCRIFGTPCALNHRPICKVWQGWWKNISPRGDAYRPFDLATDYRLYVDGKPRFDGVRDFLRSRGIQLSEGNLDDPANVETVHGLGNRKNDLANRAIAEVGVEPYTGTVQFIHQLRRDGFKIAVVTSSQNCDAVLRAAKLDDLFEVRVDGNVIQAQRLAGKPAPDTFLVAARLLRVEPKRTVVIEDAISGVEAGSNGKFGLVIGVARKGNAEELKRHGAHLVVDDLGELVD